jgi:hypothetical protein
MEHKFYVPFYFYFFFCAIYNLKVSPNFPPKKGLPPPNSRFKPAFSQKK